MVLKQGVGASTPVNPLREVKVIDSRVRDWCVEFLLQSPDLAGPEDATLENAPDINVMFNRTTSIELPAGNLIALQLTRIADRDCSCPPVPENTPNRSAFRCVGCMAKAALEHMPTPWRENAIAVRHELGETVPPADAADVAGDPAGA